MRWMANSMSPSLPDIRSSHSRCAINELDVAQTGMPDEVNVLAAISRSAYRLLCETDPRRKCTPGAWLHRILAKPGPHQHARTAQRVGGRREGGTVRYHQRRAAYVLHNPIRRHLAL